MKSWFRSAPPALVTWAAPGLIWAQDRPYEWGRGMHPMMWGAWGFGMMFMMVLFWVLVVIGIVLAIRWLTSQRREKPSDSAVEILRQRYARGEINKDEFEAKKKDLGA